MTQTIHVGSYGGEEERYSEYRNTHVTGSLSLERGLAVLEILQDANEPMGVREIARRMELSAPAVQRLLNTLAEHDYVAQAPDTRRYRIGHAVLALGRQVLRKDRLISLADPHLQALASEGYFNAFLGARRGAAGLYLLGVQSNSPVVIRSSPGETMPLHSTALGKALLVDLSDQAINDLLGGQPLPRITPRTVTDIDRFIGQIRAARTIGYTTSLDENLTGVISVGAPIRDATGAVIAALSVAFPRAVGPEFEIADIGEKVLAAAAAISAELGFTGSDAPQDEDPRNAA